VSREQNIKNLKTEKEGIKVLKSLNSNFLVPTTEERKHIYKKFKIDYSKYSRSIDGIILNVDSIDEIKSLDNQFVKTLVQVQVGPPLKPLFLRGFLFPPNSR